MIMIRLVCRRRDSIIRSCERERLGIDDMIIVIQHIMLRWCRHVLREDLNG